MDKMAFLIPALARYVILIKRTELIQPLIQHIFHNRHNVERWPRKEGGRHVEEMLHRQNLFCPKPPFAVYIRAEDLVVFLPYQVGILHGQPGKQLWIVPQQDAQPECMILVGLDRRILFQRQLHNFTRQNAPPFVLRRRFRFIIAYTDRFTIYFM